MRDIHWPSVVIATIGLGSILALVWFYGPLLVSGS